MTTHGNWTPAGISRGLRADLEAFERDAWDEAIAAKLPAEFLENLLKQMAGLEERIAFWKEAAGVEALRTYGLSQRTVAAAAGIAQVTAAKWKKAAGD